MRLGITSALIQTRSFFTSVLLLIITLPAYGEALSVTPFFEDLKQQCEEYPIIVVYRTYEQIHDAGLWDAYFPGEDYLSYDNVITEPYPTPMFYDESGELYLPLKGNLSECQECSDTEKEEYMDMSQFVLSKCGLVAPLDSYSQALLKETSGTIDGNIQYKGSDQARTSLLQNNSEVAAMAMTIQEEFMPCKVLDNCNLLSRMQLHQFRDVSVSLFNWNSAEFGTGETKTDSYSMRADYSFSYTFWGQWCAKEQKEQKEGGDSLVYFRCLQRKAHTHASQKEFLFGMTGQFDFYWFGQRPSSPVVNRLSNPGFYYRIRQPFNPFENKPSIEWLFGIEHRSNGQVFETWDSDKDSWNAENRQEAIEQYKAGNFEFMDSISQGTNYMSMRVSSDYVLGNFGGFAEAKWHFSDHGRQPWNSGKEEVGFAGYDILLLGANFRSKPPKILAGAIKSISWSGQVRAGTELADSFSVDSRLTIQVGSIPLQLQYHTGPMGVLAYYGEDVTSVGIGINLSNLGKQGR